MSALVITRAGPLCTIQDAGRFGKLRHGMSASGPMDHGAFERAAAWMGGAAPAGIEFTTAGLAFRVEGDPVGIGVDGGSFTLTCNGSTAPWPARMVLRDGDVVDITPGAWGNYGYLRIDREFRLAATMGSLATSSVAGLGGLEGRSLQAGDRMELGEAAWRQGQGFHPRPSPAGTGPIRVLWGLHADLFPAALRERFTETRFTVSARIDRMGARLEDPDRMFNDLSALALVSDAIVPGDIQVLGDGTPTVLLRDHQPTGGYPRIATLISADLDRFVQMRPGSEVQFEPVTLGRAHAALKGQVP